ncbi:MULTISPECIES: hypothetical protein [Halolamina]|uniref:Uncharacterized protein n=1 Tax=Halolamina pelagica TaxID=699431 RepID=A0A1I5MDT2_9EURY|nr:MULTISPECIES: hypothetical protein [Halolamina]NHX35983.1 hypothetical protein [Halolamina sp. R1-12]SFP07764.1 hypothetical protein SAMN05216277_101226 [Halolamina pelagica]
MTYVDALRDAGSLDDHELGELVSPAVAANTVADTLNGHPTDRPDGTGRR